MVPDDTDPEFVVVDDGEDTDFVIVDEDPTDTGIVAVPDADARYPGLQPVEALSETGFVLLDHDTEQSNTDFVLVEDSDEESLPRVHPDQSFPGIDTR